MASSRTLLAICLVACFFQPRVALIAQGIETVPANGTLFLAKFCFDFDPMAYKDGNHVGMFNMSLSLPNGTAAPEGRVELALFDDQAESYPEPSKAWSEMPCDVKLQHARWRYPLTERLQRDSGFTVELPMREHVRPRFWYVAVADCSGSSLELNYDVHLWNPLKGWQQEFSFDREGVIGICCFYMVIYTAQAVVQARAAVISQQKGRPDHPLARLLSSAVVFAATAMTFTAAHYFQYARDGIGVFIFYVVGKFSHALSKAFVMSILLLISKGNCVSKGIGPKDYQWLLNVLVPFVGVCFVLEVWGEVAESRKYTTDFVYATGAGHCVIFLDLGLLVYYAMNLFQSHERECDLSKRAFYRVWGAIYGAWFLTLPAASVLAHAVAPWVRFRVVLVASAAAHAVLLSSLMVGLWPDQQHSHLRILDTMELTALGDEPDHDDGYIDDAFMSWKPLPDQ